MSNLSIDGDRLWSTLMETAAIGGTPDGGIRRLTLGEEDRRVRDWFVGACEAVGCSVSVDRMGSIFAFRPGSDADALPVAMGSHLDTQPTGGKFDGVLGVLAGLEVLRTLHERGIETRRPLVLVNWTNEEGSRFAPAMMASGVHAGLLSLDDTFATMDRDGVTVGQALAAIGYDGVVAPGSMAFDAMFELHIEQGPILEAEAKTIGIVTGIQGMRWFRITIDGQSSHAGTTPMHLRRDALAAAAELMLKIRDKAIAERALATFGTIAVEDGSHNVVPGKVHMTLDLRAPDETQLDAVEAELDRLVSDAGFAATPIAHSCIWRSPPVTFDAACVETVAAAAEARAIPARRMISGAGHDAAYIAKVAPTAMIFVPCRDGLSHNPAESAEKSDCAVGAQILFDAVLSRAGIEPAEAQPA